MATLQLYDTHGLDNTSERRGCAAAIEYAKSKGWNLDTIAKHIADGLIGSDQLIIDKFSELETVALTEAFAGWKEIPDSSGLDIFVE